MNHEELALSDIEAGQRRQERYEYYLAALVFTTLAFSIQTATNTGVLLVSLLELGSWLSLFSSGLFALSRMYHLPVIYAYSAEINALSANIQDAIKLKREGRTDLQTDRSEVVPIEEYITAHRDAISNRDNKSNKVKAKIKRFSFAHRVLFVFGFLLLMVSRGYSQLVGAA